MDEFAYGLQKDNALTFVRAILPMFIKEDRALITLTSPPQGKAGGYYDIIRLRGPDGTPITKFYDIKTVCPKCYEQGVRLKCTHYQDRFPAHQSEERAELMKLVNECLGHGETYALETAGVTTTTDDRCFPPMLVDSIFERPFIPKQIYEYGFVNIAVDPNAGPVTENISLKASDFCIITTYQNHKREKILLGTTAFVCVHPEYYVEHIHRHVAEVRARPYLRNARIIATIECKTGFEDVGIKNAFISTGDPHIYFIKEADHKTGVPTDPIIKRAMAMEMRQMLRDGVVRCDARMFTTTPNTTVELEKQKLRKQLLDYREQVKPSTDPFKPPSYEYSGKPHKDDMAVCTQLNLKYFTHFLTADKYKRDRGE